MTNETPSLHRARAKGVADRTRRLVTPALSHRFRPETFIAITVTIGGDGAVARNPYPGGVPDRHPLRARP